MKLTLVAVLVFGHWVVANSYPSTSSAKEVIGNIISAMKGAFEASPHIVGGTEAVPHGHPYQAVLYGVQNNSTVMCGGSLISAEWILTAAHCTENVTKMAVILGAHNLKNDEPQRQESLVREMKVLNWSIKNNVNDIALLRLSTPVILITKKGSPYLKSAQSIVISNAVCNFVLFGSIKPTMVCADGSEGISVCNGDSGGPMVTTESDGEKTVIGIAAFVSKFGCDEGFPSAFTRVDKYLTWIHFHTGIPLRQS